MEHLNHKKNWFGRNWKWAIPSAGCLTLIVITAIFASTMVMKLTGLYKDSVPYNEGIETLKNNELVIELLGEPIEIISGIEGKIHYSNDDGNVDLKIPVKGPKGEAVLLIIAEKNKGKWSYHTMKVTISESMEKINLLTKKDSIKIK